MVTRVCGSELVMIPWSPGVWQDVCSQAMLVEKSIGEPMREASFYRWICKLYFAYMSACVMAGPGPSAGMLLSAW